MSFYSEHTDKKFIAQLKTKDCGKDTNITPSDPISGKITQEHILTRDELAKME